jgi:hypothetical protein
VRCFDFAYQLGHILVCTDNIDRQAEQFSADLFPPGRPDLSLDNVSDLCPVRRRNQELFVGIDGLFEQGKYRVVSLFFEKKRENGIALAKKRRS